MSHKIPCPDCGARMLMQEHRDRYFYKCQKKGCDGKHMCHRNGTPVGTPINKHGRRLRYETHKYLNQLTKDRFVQTQLLLKVVGEEHLGSMRHSKLNRVKFILRQYKKERWRMKIFEAEVELLQWLNLQMRLFKSEIRQKTGY